MRSAPADREYQRLESANQHLPGYRVDCGRLRDIRTNTGVFGTLNFGTQSGVAANTVNASYLQSTSINLACTPGTTLSMSINQGNNFTTTRNLKLPNFSNTVPYTLFSNASRTTVIPVNQAVPLSYSNANNITLPIYGQLQLPGTARAGVYTDTLTVTLSW